MADPVSEVVPVPEVLSEIQSGEGLSLSAAGRLFPGHRGGAAVDPSTVFRWVTRGTRTTTGHAVKLEAVRVGGRWLTSRGAVARFVAALTEAADPAPVSAPPVSRSRTASRRANDRAIARLKSLGA
jgi:hypothetical protein